LLALIEGEPAVAMALLHAMATMVRATNERLSDVLALDVPGRLAKWLLARGAGSGRLTLDLSQESLALQLGTTRVTVNRSLRRLERLGLIEANGSDIRLIDIKALQSIVDG
jgi:CRP-like cAMP-binding protein